MGNLKEGPSRVQRRKKRNYNEFHEDQEDEQSETISRTSRRRIDSEYVDQSKISTRFHQHNRRAKAIDTPQPVE